MNRKELEKLTCKVRLRLGAAKLATTGNKAALVERLYLHLREPLSEPEPEREDVPDATPESEDSSESSSEGATTEPDVEAEHPPPPEVEPRCRRKRKAHGLKRRRRSTSSSGTACFAYEVSYPEAVAMRTIDAENVAEELVKLFARVGIPSEILTDQGSNFTSQLLAEFYRLHVRPIRTTPYHPQTDGLVERFNQTLKAMLLKAAVQEGKDWDLLIPYVLFAYREVPQCSTGFSPFELLYGRDVRGPLDVLKESWEAMEKSGESVVSHMLSIRDKMESMSALVRENLEKAQETEKRWYDKNARQRVFNEGVKDMLREFFQDSTTQVAGWAEDIEVDVQDEIPVWRELGSGTFSAEDIRFGEQLTAEQRGTLRALLGEFSSVMSNTPGQTTLTEHQGRWRKRYRIIEPSMSEWCSPIVPVKKKDGSLRLCVDYRRLNSVSQSDAYPVPRVDDLIDQLLLHHYYGLDPQVPVSEDAKQKTAFATPFGLYQFNRMPFGLKGAPATFQRLVDRGAGLTAKLSKCCFGTTSCTYLGHVVGSGVVRPEPSKVHAVLTFPIPATKTHVRAFLGLTGYYRRFIPNYASLAVPLTDLTKKSAPMQVQWNAQCNQAFEDLKNLLCSSPVLQSPDFEKPFILQTDASDRGLGAVLSQRDDRGSDHPVSYYSRKLLPREERYSTIEKECLAIKMSMCHFRTYLMGCQFTVETDHRALLWMDRLKDSNSRLTRWSLSLQPFDFTVTHRKGPKNGNADGLSRMPWSEDAATELAAEEGGRDVKDCMKTRPNTVEGLLSLVCIVHLATGPY
eukprot:Em0001g3215a